MKPRARSRLAIACVAAWCLAPAANAVSLTATGTLEIEIGPFPSVAIPGSGVAVVNGSGGGSHLNTLALPANLFQTAGYVLPVTDPAAAPVGGIQVTVGNAGATIMAGGGAIPLVGMTKVCLFGPCSAAVANLAVPLAVVGAGGASLITASVNLTVIGAPWTTATASVGTITRMGFAHGPASQASTTALSSGEIRLVTPIFVSTNIPDFSILPAFATMTLHFVPEPATLVLLCGGLALLAAAGRARLSRAP